MIAEFFNVFLFKNKLLTKVTEVNENVLGQLNYEINLYLINSIFLFRPARKLSVRL